MDSTIELSVVEAFYDNRQSYGTRRLKKSLQDKNIQFSRKKIKQIMTKFNLHSTYTLAYFKVYSGSSNQSLTPNKLNRLFTDSRPTDSIVTNLR